MWKMQWNWSNIMSRMWWVWKAFNKRREKGRLFEDRELFWM